MKILLAEDNLINQELVQDYLEDAACELVLAENGLQATQSFARERFDLVLMDCHMPVMDGYEATRIIRELELRHGLPTTPVIAVTAYAMQDDQNQCVSAGMNDYLSKPFSCAELLAKIRQWAPKG